MAEHFSIRTPALSLGKPRDVDEKENWPELVVLASGSLVELPGIEPAAKSSVTCEKTEFDYAKRREKT
jgi:hypothetical protein